VSLDPRTPVLAGAGQVLQRIEDPSRAAEPLALMQQAAERAADDAGSRALLGRLSAVFVPRGLWPYSNPGALLRERLGSPGARTGIGPISGSTVQVLVSNAAKEIAAGTSDVVLVVGGECERTKRRARAAEAPLAWTEQGESVPDQRFGSDDPNFGWWEQHYRVRPIQTFSMYENALRAKTGESPAAHRARLAALWAGFAGVASKNPYAWIQDAPSAERIATPSEDNPMVAFPYTKRMVANMVVDLAAAVIVCSLETAERLGVPEERRVFLQVATDALRTCGVPERRAYSEEPAMGLAGNRALALANAGPDDFAHVDLYSCFPSAVQIAAAELGFDLGRPLTVTGGLTFAGGPFNSYVLHAIATLIARLREAPGTRGFVSSVGGYMSKHAFGVYGTEPAPTGFVHESLDEEATALPTRVGLRDYAGTATVETFAVLPGRDGSAGSLLFSCLTEAGERAFATSVDADLVAAVETDELCGRVGTIREGSIDLG
jgi:acetyl-CoA C-acetyltransferase